MTIIKEEGVYAGEFLISESEGSISRDSVVIASGEGVLVPGAVLGKITATGKYAVYDNAASDGTQVAAAVLYGGVDATSVDAKAVAITRLAEVKAELLVYEAGQDSTAKTAAVADLKAQFVIAR